MGQIHPLTEESVQEAVTRLRAGALVAFPTETVYGLGGDATNDEAVARIFEAKGRPEFNPLIVHVHDAAAAVPHVEVSDLAIRLASSFWPGALTLVMRRAEGSTLSRLVSAGLDTVAVRVPSAAAAQVLLRAFRRPIAAPSANPSGRLSPTTAEHVLAGLGDAAGMILDDGPCPGGLESTIVDVTGETAVLLREGLVARAEIEAVVGPLAGPGEIEDGGSGTGGGQGAGHIRAPGMLSSHYAPDRPLRLEATEVGADEALLAFGADAPAGAAIVRNLSPKGDLVEAAANLFAMLHDLDAADVARIAVMPVPEEGLGAAINDRLRRAAAPRDAD